MTRETSLASVLVKERDLQFREFPLPDIGDDDGLIRIEACGVCGADLSPYRGDFMNGFFIPPLILGHEIVGIVDRIGRSAERHFGVSEGDRVVLEEPIPCGTCRACLTGRYQRCPAPRYGAQTVDVAPSLWGGFAEHIYLHPRARLQVVPAGVDPLLAPLFVPISNGIFWVQEIGGLQAGQTVVIQGPGQHGLGCVVAAKDAGADCIIVTGTSADHDRLQLALKLGADHIINVQDGTDPIERIREITGDELADVVVHVADHSPEAFSQALEFAGDAATVVNVGSVHGPAIVSPDAIWMKELTIVGIRGRYGGDIVKALELLAQDDHPFAALSTHNFALADIGKAFDVAALETDEQPIHVTVVPEQR
jgi:threonine dehydrogenase-like Zn-dependent dehydrogenase